MVEQCPHPTSAQCVDWIRKNEQQRRMVVVEDGNPGAREARLRYSVMQEQPHASALRVCLETGRKHQIRLQLALFAVRCFLFSKRGFTFGVTILFEKLDSRSANTVDSPLNDPSGVLFSQKSMRFGFI